MFEEIDLLLYRDSLGKSSTDGKPSSMALYDEIGQWSKKFPHIRLVVFKSLVPYLCNSFLKKKN